MGSGRAVAVATEGFLKTNGSRAAVPATPVAGMSSPVQHVRQGEKILADGLSGWGKDIRFIGLLQVSDLYQIMWCCVQPAVSMAGRVATLVRELKNIKSEFHFMQECYVLREDENKRLRDGRANGGAAPEENNLAIEMNKAN